MLPAADTRRRREPLRDRRRARMRAVTAGETVIRRYLPTAVFGLTFLVFLPSLRGEFVNWDDLANFVNNPDYRGLGWQQIKWMWTTTLLGHYIPLTWMTFGLNYVLGGMIPWGYHLVNVLLHAANAALFYSLARRLLGAAGVEDRAGGWGAAFAALVFGIHPLRVESVAWITERRDVLYAFFFLLSTLAYLRSVQDEADDSRRWRRLSLLAFVAALLSKSAALTLPLALVVIDVYPLRRVARVGWGHLLREKAPYVTLAAGGAMLAVIAVVKGARFTGYGDYGPAARVAMVAYNLVFYPAKWLSPVGLSPLYELPPRVDPLDARFLAPLIVLIAVTVVLVVSRHRWPGALVAWVYSGLMVVPVSGFVHAGFQLAHDRYSYISGLGFAILAGGLFASQLSAPAAARVASARAALSAVAAVAIVVALGLGTWRQTKFWTDSITLWERAIAIEPSCVLCRSNLGTAWLDRGRPREAEQAYREALALRGSRAATHNNLATALTDQNRYDEAEREFREAFRLDPTLVAATANLGSLYARQRRWDDAISLLRAAFRTKPDFPSLRINLGQALRNRGAELAQAGRLDDAIARFREASEIWRDDPETLRFLGQALLQQGQVMEAIGPLGRSVALAPRHAPARFWLAKAYLLAGDRTRADAELLELRVLDPVMANSLAEWDAPRSRAPGPR